MERDKLLTKIIAQDFTVLDLQLFLDTHPDDKTALKAFNDAVNVSKNLHEEFEKSYGALTNHHASTDINRYDWVTPDWPWENTYIK